MHLQSAIDRWLSIVTLRWLNLLYLRSPATEEAVWLGAARVERQSLRLRVAFILTMMAVVVTSGHGLEFLLLWVIPYVTVYQVLRYWSDIADHAGLRSSDPWQATRSWDAAWVVGQFLAPHNSNWHLSHHLYLAVPQYRIQRLHRTLRKVPAYQGAHHCDGFLRPRRSCRPSVVQDVLRPERLTELKSCQTESRGQIHTARGCAESCLVGWLAGSDRQADD